MKLTHLCSLFAASLLVSAAHADTLTFTLNPSTVIAAPGSTATYTATISAPLSNAAPVYLNGDSLTLGAPQDITRDDSDLFLNFDAFLNPGQSETGALFTLTIPGTESLATYMGTYVLQGGANDQAQGSLAQQQFTLTVGATTPISATPEPSSYLLMASGLVGAFALMRRNRTSLQS